MNISVSYPYIFYLENKLRIMNSILGAVLTYGKLCTIVGILLEGYVIYQAYQKKPTRAQASLLNMFRRVSRGSYSVDNSETKEDELLPTNILFLSLALQIIGTIFP